MCDRKSQLIEVYQLAYSLWKAQRLSEAEKVLREFWMVSGMRSLRGMLLMAYILRDSRRYVSEVRILQELLEQFGELPVGYDHKYVYSHFGYNLKITDMQAAVGCSQLTKLPKFIEKRRKNWQFLADALADLNDAFILPEAMENSEPSWFGFLLTLRENVGFTRDALIQYLEEHNIQTRLLFAGNLLKHPCFDEMRRTGEGYRVVGSLENTDRIMRDTFWIGVYPGMTDEMLEYMSQTIHKFVAKGKDTGNELS